MLVPSSTAG
jgi:integrase